MYEPRVGRNGETLPPAMVRDPTPKQGTLELQDIREVGQGTAAAEASFRAMCDAYGEDPVNWAKDYSWTELFVLIEGHKLYFFKPDAMFLGYNPADALASVPITSIDMASVQVKLNVLELHTKSDNVYRFRSEQKGDVSRWAAAITHGDIAGAYDVTDNEDEELSVWDKLGERSRGSGGLESAISKPADRLEESEDHLLQELFNTIMNCNGDKPKMVDPATGKRVDADFFDTADLMKWCSNRFSLVRDPKAKKELEQLINFESIEAAVVECMKHDEDNVERLTFPVFKRGMCDYTSGIRKIVLAMLATFPKLDEWEYLERLTGELTTADYILMYHTHLQQVVKASRKQMHQDDDSHTFITNKETLAKAQLSGVEQEVVGLLKKFEDYNHRLRTLQPSLRELTQCHGIDDVFDSHLLPGDRWDSKNPRVSWAK